MSKLRFHGAPDSRGKSEPANNIEEKLRNLRLIAVAVGVMVAFLAMRLILVALRNFYTISLGYLVFYGIATIIPEVLCCLVMLALVLFSFYQSRHISLSPKMNTNSMFQSASTQSSTAAEMEQMRYDV